MYVHKLKTLLLLILLPFACLSQAKRTPPPPPRQKPGKDSVMVIDQKNPITSKTFQWKGSAAQITLNAPNTKECRKISVYCNGKRVLSHYCVGTGKKHLKLKLDDLQNVVVIRWADPSNGYVDLNAILQDTTMLYDERFRCSKGKNDTIILRRNP
jgi:hypothetical protein